MAQLQQKIAYQATDAFSIPTGSDTVPLVKDTTNNPKGYGWCSLYSGAGGDLKVTMVDGGTVTFVGVQANTFIPIAVQQVWATPVPPAGLLGLVEVTVTH